MILINELKGRMTAKGYTQEKIAKKLGISSKSIGNKFKSGILKSNEIEKLMEILDIDDPRPIFFANEVT